MEHLADAPIANILILAGVIFLAVGLFGRVGGFIGSIFGNIEAGQNSRVIAGVMGAFLIVGRRMAARAGRQVGGVQIESDEYRQHDWRGKRTQCVSIVICRAECRTAES